MFHMRQVNTPLNQRGSAQSHAFKTVRLEVAPTGYITALEGFNLLGVSFRGKDCSVFIQEHCVTVTQQTLTRGDIQLNRTFIRANSV